MVPKRISDAAGNHHNVAHVASQKMMSRYVDGSKIRRPWATSPWAIILTARFHSARYSVNVTAQ